MTQRQHENVSNSRKGAILEHNFPRPKAQVNFVKGKVRMFDDDARVEDAPSHNITIEALTWWELAVYVGNELAGGAIGEIGAQIFNRATHQWTLERVYQESVIAMREIVDAAIAESEINTASDRMKSAAQTLSLYQAAPTHRLDTLASAESLAVESLNTFTSERHRLAGLGNFLIAGGLVLTLLQERLIRFRDPGEITNIRNMVGNFTSHYQGTYPLCTDNIRRQFTQGYIIVQRPQNAPKYYFYAWQYRGRPCSGPQNTDGEAAERDGKAALEAHIASEIDKLHVEIIRPADGVVENWNTMAENSTVPA